MYWQIRQLNCKYLAIVLDVLPHGLHFNATTSVPWPSITTSILSLSTTTSSRATTSMVTSMRRPCYRLTLAYIMVSRSVIMTSSFSISSTRCSWWMSSIRATPTTRIWRRSSMMISSVMSLATSPWRTVILLKEIPHNMYQGTVGIL